MMIKKLIISSNLEELRDLKVLSTFSVDKHVPIRAIPV